LSCPARSTILASTGGTAAGRIFMKQRRLGRTGLSVSEVCLGTMTFGSMADEQTAFRILDLAVEGGVDFLDTAEIYPVPPMEHYAGRTEEIVGRWLKEKQRDTLVIATKVAGHSGGWFKTPVRSGRGTLDAHNIERAVEGSLRRLGTDYIDLYQTHWPDPDLPYEETLRALDRIVASGKVRYVGCSNETAYGLTKALMTSEREGIVRYETIQNNFSLLNRRFEDELKVVCRREQVSCLPYSPLGGGVLSGKYQGGQWPDLARFSMYRHGGKRGVAMTNRFVNEKTLASTERFGAIAQELDLSPVAFAVAWTLSRDFVGSTIVGATRSEQVPDLLRGSEVTLSADVLDRCDAISREILYPMG
jgi:aryl-alcohol dehydrogenase-like predicted oxidoreductase